MSARPHDGPATFVRNDPRRPSTSFFQIPYTRRSNVIDFDSDVNPYASQSVSPPYRRNYSDNYRPTQNHQNRYYNGTSSPDYSHSRGFTNDTRDYHQQSTTRNSQWSRPGPSTPRDKVDRNAPTRVFEPSDSWKQSHDYNASNRSERYSQTSRYSPPNNRRNAHSPQTFRQPLPDRYSPSRSYDTPFTSMRRASSRDRAMRRSPSFSEGSSRSRSRHSRSPHRSDFNRRRHASSSSSDRGRSAESSRRKRTRSRSDSRSSIASSRASDQQPPPTIQLQHPAVPDRKGENDAQKMTDNLDVSSLPEPPPVEEEKAIVAPELQQLPEPSSDNRDQSPPLSVDLLAPVHETQDESPEVNPSEAEPPPPLRPVPVIDFTMEDIPSPSGAKTIGEALRIVVMTRLLCDRQTQEERVNPVLQSNLERLGSTPRSSATSEELTKELIKNVEQRHRQDVQIGVFPLIRDALVKRLEARHSEIQEKNEQLRREYITRHRKWLAQCATLDEAVKPPPAAEEPAPPSGRMTRRTAALGMFGDAVRSDLEMEQIIASLGFDEATDPVYLSTRNYATIPDMISVTQGRVDYRYEDTNLLVHDTDEYFTLHTGIDDWTPEETQIFLDKYAAFPKQFGVIADFLPEKTAAQCVAFYYLRKKSQIDFRKVLSQYAPNKRRRRKSGKQKANALMADIRQHDDEVRGSSSKNSGRKTLIETQPRKSAVRKTAVSADHTPISTPTPEPESRAKRRRMLGSNRVLTTEDDGPEENDTDSERRPVKKAKRTRKTRSTAVVADQKAADWDREEKELFLKLFSQHGHDFKRISASMPSRTVAQLTEYYQSNTAEIDKLVKDASRSDTCPASETPVEPAPESAPFYPVWTSSSAACPTPLSRVSADIHAASTLYSAYAVGYAYTPFAYTHKHPQS